MPAAITKQDKKEVSAKKFMELLTKNGLSEKMHDQILSNIEKAPSDLILVRKRVYADGKEFISASTVNGDVEAQIFNVTNKSAHEFTRNVFELLNKTYFS